MDAGVQKMRGGCFDDLFLLFLVFFCGDCGCCGGLYEEVIEEVLSMMRRYGDPSWELGVEANEPRDMVLNTAWK